MREGVNASTIAHAKELAADVLERPGYYGKLAAYAGSVFIALAVVRTIVTAIDPLPVLNNEELVEEP